MNAYVDHELCCALLSESDETVVHYKQEGVCVTRGADQVVGTLFVIDMGSAYVVWAPYTYIFCVSPGAVSPSARSTIASETHLPMYVDGTLTELRLEWSTVVCFPLYRLTRVARRGRRVKSVTLVRDNTHIEPALRFQDGGCTKFWDVIGRHVVLRGDPRSGEEFIVEQPLINNNNNDRADARGEARDGSLLGSVMSKFRSALGPSTTPPATPHGSLTTSAGTVPLQRHSVGGTPLSQSPESGGCIPSAEDDTKLHITSLEARARSASFSNFRAAQTLRKATRSLSHPLDELTWMSSMDPQGRLTLAKWNELKTIIFNGGMEPTLRKEVWPFLLGMYDVASTLQEREKIRAERSEYYCELRQQWQSIRPQQAARFSIFRERQIAIHNDIIRTDRGLEQYESEESPMLVSLKNIVNTYSFYNFDLGYCQGMTDAASPLLLTMHDEAEAFWAFAALMDGQMETNFHSDSSNTMQKQLSCVSRMIQLFVPTLSDHLERTGGSHLSFIFRWLLVRFKREFSLDQICLLWEVGWACPYTRDHHLVVALALLRELTPVILELGASFEDLQRITNEMAFKMDVEDVVVFTQDIYERMLDQHRRRQRGIDTLAGDTTPTSLETILSAYETQIQQ
eukprot:PhM_4_TR12394/c0_g1_i1/m.10980/K20168/TBC1D15; TBC1 domain family member 15